ncbi:MAG: ribosome maturation factor RimP [Steroidobacteraceae bacterium]
MTSTVLRDRLIVLLEPLVEQLGYELVDVEANPGRGSGLLRVYLDCAAGVGVDDCERVSREVSALLDVEDPMPGAFTLEVSSPGFDRVLRKPAHYGRFRGERVRVELVEARDGRRRYTGDLVAVSEHGIELEVDGEAVAVDFAAIDRARLAPL